MNYFELYPGDYLRDTTRLTLIEHGAYLRLLMAYYAEEEALPADHGELYVIAGAVSTPEKAAVKKVAERFFPVSEDGLRHNARADHELERFAQRSEGSVERRSNAAERKRRSRERRQVMFEALLAAGVTPNFNATMDELVALHEQHVTRDGHAMSRVTKRDVTSKSQRDGTATTSHKPQAIQEQKPAPHARSPQDPSPGDLSPTEAGRACALLRHAGCVRANPSHPDLLAALAEGVSPEALVHTYRENPTASNPFAWAIATARGRHAEGAKPITGESHADRPPGRNLSAVERVRAANERAEQRDQQPTVQGHARVLGHD